MRLVTVGSILVTTALAHAGTLYPRTQSVTVPPPSKPRPAAPPAATVFKGIAVIGLAGPPGFAIPPAPGEIARLEAAVARAPGQPDPLLDLASAYGRQMIVHQANAASHTARADAAVDQAIKAQAQRDASSEVNRAKNMLLRAVSMFKALVDDPAHASYPREPDALFAYAFVLQSGKYMKEARSIYDRLLKNHPASPHVPNAHLAFAEYFLDAGQLADAEARLRVVLKFPRSNAYWAAMYRMGFIHMQAQRHQEALETYYQVTMGVRGNAALAGLAEEARRGFVAAYVPIGKVNKAYAAFQRVDATQAIEMLRWLADGYTQAGMHQQALDIGTELARLQPSGGASCASAAGLARSTAPSLATTVANIEALLRVRERLEAQQAMSASVSTQCRADAIELAGDAARGLHLEAQKTLDPATFSAAVTLYTGYVDTIPDAPDAAAMRVLGAEAMWSLADLRQTPELWDRAATAFGKIVPRTSDGTLAAVLAWKNALGADPSFGVQAGPFDIRTVTPGVPAQAPLALDARAAGLVAAVDAYGATVKDQDDEELVRGRFLAATLFRNARDYDRAAKLLADLVPRLGRRNDHANRELAANLLLDTLAHARQYDRVLQVADGFAADKAFIDRAPTLRKTIEYLRSHSLRR